MALRRNPITGALEQDEVPPIPSALPSQLDPAYEPQFQPKALPLNARPSLAVDLNTGVPRQPSRLDQLTEQYKKVGARPESTLGKLGQALATFAPTAIAGALGGTYAASGAAEGTSEALDIKREQENLQRKSLLTEMENERQRQERMGERQLTADVARQGHEERLQGIKETVAGREDVANIAANQRSLAAELGAFTKTRGQDIGAEQHDKDREALASLRQAQTDLANANADLAKVKADPSSPAFQLAQQRATVAQANHDIAAQRLGLSEKQFEMRSKGTEGGVPLPGSIQTDTGQTVGTAFQQNVRPTGTERTRGDMASSAREQLSDIVKIVQKHPEVFGPVSGRKTDVTVWLGSQDPDAQAFKAARTIAADHLAGTFGGRSEPALAALDNAIGQFKDNPAAMLAGIQQLDKAAQKFEQAGKVRTTGSSATTAKRGKFNPATGKVEY